jgi:hypothetical protein
MEAKKKAIKHRVKKASMPRLQTKKISKPQKTHEEKVRLTIHCTSDQRKYMKMYAAHEDMSMNDFILECVLSKIAGCQHPHIPNAETAAALNATERGEGLIHFDSVEDFLKSLRS